MGHKVTFPPGVTEKRREQSPLEMIEEVRQLIKNDWRLTEEEKKFFLNELEKKNECQQSDFGW